MQAKGYPTIAFGVHQDHENSPRLMVLHRNMPRTHTERYHKEVPMHMIPDAILLNPGILQHAGIDKCPRCNKLFKVTDGNCCCGFTPDVHEDAIRDIAVEVRLQHVRG